jgi:hypothetical protein
MVVARDDVWEISGDAEGGELGENFTTEGTEGDSGSTAGKKERVMERGADVLPYSRALQNRRGSAVWADWSRLYVGTMAWVAG